MSTIHRNQSGLVFTERGHKYKLDVENQHCGNCGHGQDEHDALGCTVQPCLKSCASFLPADACLWCDGEGIYMDPRYAKSVVKVSTRCPFCQGSGKRAAL